MHGIGAHSAVAIKRQRRRREQQARKKARNRNPMNPANNIQQMSKDGPLVTMFHVGAVFLTVGLFLMLAAVITNETKRSEIAELIGTGIVCLVIGLFLVILNRFYGQKEEEELQKYVETRLARTRSGQRLYHDNDSYPEALDENAGSKTPSMDSGMNNSEPPNGKKNKKKISGPSSGSGHGSHDQNYPTTTRRIRSPTQHFKMIAAMPQCNFSNQGKGKGSIGFISRPHKLSLHFRPPLMQHQVTPTPSPVNSPPSGYQPPREGRHHRFARNFLSKRCIFQLSVLAPLVGAILLFIGLIQLTPGAEANPYSLPLITAGSATLVLGLLVILLRVYFTWELNRLYQRRDLPQIKVNEPSVTDPDVEKIGSSEGPNNPNGTAAPTKSLGNNVELDKKSGKTTPSPNKSPSPTPNLHPSPKAPPRSRSKDRDKDNAKEESSKLLQDQDDERKNSKAKGGGDRGESPGKKV